MEIAHPAMPSKLEMMIMMMMMCWLCCDDMDMSRCLTRPFIVNFRKVSGIVVYFILEHVLCVAGNVHRKTP